MTLKIQIIAAGSLKTGPQKELLDLYAKRLTSPLKIVEINVRQSTKISAEHYMKHLSEKDVVVLLDETGKNISSRDFADILKKHSETRKRVSFIIGGAEGIPPEIKKLATDSISFGKLTWPHLLVRALLVEQLYRAQQITSGHPYHRD